MNCFCVRRTGGLLLYCAVMTAASLLSAALFLPAGAKQECPAERPKASGARPADAAGATSEAAQEKHPRAAVEAMPGRQVLQVFAEQVCNAAKSAEEREAARRRAVLKSRIGSVLTADQEARLLKIYAAEAKCEKLPWDFAECGESTGVTETLQDVLGDELTEKLDARLTEDLDETAFYLTERRVAFLSSLLRLPPGKEALLSSALHDPDLTAVVRLNEIADAAGLSAEQVEKLRPLYLSVNNDAWTAASEAKRKQLGITEDEAISFSPDEIQVYENKLIEERFKPLLNAEQFAALGQHLAQQLQAQQAVAQALSEQSEDEEQHSASGLTVQQTF